MTIMFKQKEKPRSQYA